MSARGALWWRRHRHHPAVPPSRFICGTATIARVDTLLLLCLSKPRLPPSHVLLPLLLLPLLLP